VIAGRGIEKKGGERERARKKKKRHRVYGKREKRKK
jgi:hypothetical protein